MQTAVRRANRADFNVIMSATLQTVWDDLPPEERAEMDRTTWEKHFRSKIQPLIQGGRTETWVAVDASGSLLGYLILGPGGGFLTPEEYGFIYDVWVAPESRGKGVGRSLVGRAIEWARARGYRRIKLEVSESNARAKHLYEELGFHDERHHMSKTLGT